MSERHFISLQRRLQALRAIPDNQRTEEQWDELNELEITLAPVNRITPPPAERVMRPLDGKPVIDNLSQRRRKPLRRLPKKPLDAGSTPE